MSTAYYLQTNSQTERINQKVKVFLRHYINYKQDNWTKWLATAEFQYNDKKHTATGHSPFYVNYGRHPWKGNLTVEIEIPSLEDLLKKMETTREEAKTAMERTKETMKRQYDKRTCQSQSLKTGEQVWLETRNIQTNWPSKKLDQKRYRPFTIKEEIRQGTYRLELPEGWAIHNVFNEDLLTRCKKAEFASQHKDSAPPPDIINEEKEYKVKEIRGHCKKGRDTQFLVHWKGYGNEHNQWMAEANLEHTKEAIQDYWM